MKLYIVPKRNKKRYSPLHAVGAHLHPSLFYNDKSSIQRDPEVIRDVMIYIERMFLDPTIQDKINMQQYLYKESARIFGFSSSKRLKDKKMLGKISFVNCFNILQIF